MAFDTLSSSTLPSLFGSLEAGRVETLQIRCTLPLHRMAERRSLYQLLYQLASLLVVLLPIFGSDTLVTQDSQEDPKYSGAAYVISYSFPSSS